MTRSVTITALLVILASLTTPKIYCQQSATAARSLRKTALSLHKMEAITHTEDILEKYGERVTVEIRAKPGRCNVKYRPIVGEGLHLDAGTTDIEKSLTPRW
jgi:hypothetical protein